MSTLTLLTLAIFALIGVVDSRATTRVGSAAAAGKIFFYNQYSADNAEIRDCDFGGDHTHMFIVQLEVDHCQHVKVPQIAEEKYMMITTDPDTGVVDGFRDFCDATCANCVESLSGGMAFTPCFQTFEGSSAVFEEYCPGSANLQAADGFTAYYYTTNNCTVSKGNLHDVQYIRNYPKKNTNGCVADHVEGDVSYFYSLTFTEENGQMRFTARMACTDKNCTTCEHHFSDLDSGHCSAGSTHSMEMKTTASLENCRGGPPAPTPPSPTPPGPTPPTPPPTPPPSPPGPPGEMWGCWANRCAIIHNGFFFNESACLAAKACEKPTPPPTLPPSRYTCFAYRCVRDSVGNFDSESACMASDECKKPPPPPTPPQPQYNCSGYPNYQCMQDDNGDMTSWVCENECVEPADHYACIEQKCVAVSVAGPGVTKEICEQICHPTSSFESDVVENGMLSSQQHDTAMPRDKLGYAEV
eukprot:m.150897 g.150897  ORF g.150897 m.150897 type:complete len:470 (-) comp30748_c1_seq3:42-1451(-)